MKGNKFHRETPRPAIFISCGRTLPVELQRQFKAECSRRGKTMTQVIAKMMRRWLREIEK